MARTVALLLVVALLLGASSPAPSFRTTIQRELDAYLRDRGKIEHISAILVSISLPKATGNLNVASGTTAFDGKAPVDPLELVQIGSNTKAFTAILLLQLEAEHKLSIDDPIGRWLPQYPAWKRVTIRQLLDMTSGIPTYDDSASMLSDYARNPYRNFTPAQLIAYVYPKVLFAPGKGWHYSNTDYLLAQLIIERVTNDTFANELQRRIFTPLRLASDTYYSDHIYPQSVLARMPAGYFYNHSRDNAPLKPLLGRDVKAMSTSWAQGAGAMVSNLPNLVSWVRALYNGPLIPGAQRRELLSIVSNKTGRPIRTTSLSDARGFGLGVAQLTSKGVGTLWYYEGESLGYRTLYAYFPQSGTVIAIAINSQPTTGQDRIGSLVTQIYGALKSARML